VSRGNLRPPSLVIASLRRRCGNLAFGFPNTHWARRLLRRPKCGLLAMAVGEENESQVPEIATSGQNTPFLAMTVGEHYATPSGGVAISLWPIKDKG